ncbi:MAG: hypothetical protein P4L46_18925 [Fimbriimonas sp.]|nr:hypothetical protein [Fimbriimonas sp.]
MIGYRGWFAFAVVMAGMSLSSFAEAGSADTLGEFLSKMTWDASKSGTLIALDPDHVMARTGGGNLLSFDRKLATVGKMSAVVPTDMVLINDELTEPNMYDGLPREAKVLYLLSTLNSHQLDLVRTVGVDQHDLQGEQIKVLRSLLPKPLAWKAVRVNESETSGNDLDHGVVPASQTDRVRLKIQNELEISLHLQSRPLAYRPLQASDMLGKAGDKVFVRDESGPQTPFGADPKVVEPNKPKPSQLNVEDPKFSVQVEVRSGDTVAEILKRVGLATGLEFHAHLRVANLPIRAFGSAARAGDLLKAIALCVTGTYRKVGPAYVLTSDLIGARVRELRFAFWKGSADKAANERADAWKALLGKTGALSKVGFDPNDPLAPDRRTLDLLNGVAVSSSNGEPNGQPGVNMVLTAELSPAIREFVNRYASANPSSGYVTDRVGLDSLLQYTFVLPDGQPLHPERSPLGAVRYFHDWPKHAVQEVTTKFKVDPSGKHPIIVRAESDVDATKAVDLAHEHGISEIWLETHRKSSLLAAQNRGVQISLVIRPWEAFDRVTIQNLDRNVLGDPGAKLGIRRKAELEWHSYVDSAEGIGGEPPEPYDSVTPLEEGLPRRWATLSELGQTPGLAGVVVLDTEPTGYEANDTRSNFGYYSKWMAMMHEFGYSDAMRLAYLREHSIDPIDIDEPELYLNIDLEQPFFPDYAYIHDGRDNDATQDMRLMLAAWCSYRAKLNQRAILPFFQRFSDLSTPIWVMPRLTAIHVPLESNSFVVPWTPGADVPTREPSRRESSFPGAIDISPFNEDSLPAVSRFLSWALASPKVQTAIDMSSVPANRLPIFMDRWFPKVPGK